MASTAQRIILTGAVAGIAAMGSIYGAQLKAQHESQEAARKIQSQALQNQTLQASPEQQLKTQREAEKASVTRVYQRIAALESQRVELVRHRQSLQKKLDGLHERTASNQQKEAIRQGSKSTEVDQAAPNVEDLKR